MWRNPIILALLAAFSYRFLALPLPDLIEITLRHLADIVMPLALLLCGAAIRLREWPKPTLLAACFSKVVLAPVLGLTACAVMQTDTTTALVVFCICASPCASAGFVMAQRSGSNSAMAAQAIALSTIFCLPVFILAIIIMTCSSRQRQS